MEHQQNSPKVSEVQGQSMAQPRLKGHLLRKQGITVLPDIYTDGDI